MGAAAGLARAEFFINRGPGAGEGRVTFAWRLVGQGKLPGIEGQSRG